VRERDDRIGGLPTYGIPDFKLEKRVGGGDTGADCLGTAHRQGAASLHQLELCPAPREARTEAMPFPSWPNILRSGSAHEEGGTRLWGVLTTRLEGEAGAVRRLHAVHVVWVNEGGRPVMREIAGSALSLPCDLCLLSLGFSGPERGGVIEQLGLALDSRGNVRTDDRYMSSVVGVFAAGDLRRGQSLVVTAIAEGRAAARAIDAWLMGHIAS